MAWLGFAILITIYWCIFLSMTSGRLSWALICGWLFPILAMTIAFEEGMQVNGLMVLLCFVMFMVCRRGISDVRMWNVKNRRKHSVLFGILYVLQLLIMFYCFSQAQIQGYILNVQGWGGVTQDFWRMFLTIVPMMLLNWMYTQLVYGALERIYCKDRKLVLLNCHFFMANESGVEKGIQQGYFLEGVQNGISYYFRMTRRAYLMLKREKNLKINAKVGLFGGVYVTDVEQPELLKRTRRGDRKLAKWGILGFALASALGIYLFF